MTTAAPTAGEYVNRTHAVTEIGTFTGVPATAHGTYISGVAPTARTGQYYQYSPRRAHGQNPTGSIRLSPSALAHH